MIVGGKVRAGVCYKPLSVQYDSRGVLQPNWDILADISNFGSSLHYYHSHSIKPLKSHFNQHPHQPCSAQTSQLTPANLLSMIFLPF